MPTPGTVEPIDVFEEGVRRKPTKPEMTQGPMNHAPVEEGFLAGGLQRVGWHSVEDIMALGCAMRGEQLARLNYGVPKELRKPDGHKISALAWAKSGTWLVIGTATGAAEIHAFGK